MSSNELITYSQPRSFITESFRTLRANLQFLGVGDTLKAVLLAGGGFYEGASFMTANLGVVFAQAGQKVIVVDCDLRKPQQHLIFNIDNNHGLSSILSGFKGPDEVLKSTSMAGVKILTAGPIPVNPTELLGSQVMKQLIDALREKADVILLDAPPLAVVSDAAVLSKKVDGVLMVVRSQAASHNSLTKTKEILTYAKANILGVALNFARATELSEKYNDYIAQSGMAQTQKKKKIKKPAQEEEKKQVQ